MWEGNKVEDGEGGRMKERVGACGVGVVKEACFLAHWQFPLPLQRETSSGLGVSHYMLEPVQRIPRYRLLLAGV